LSQFHLILLFTSHEWYITLVAYWNFYKIYRKLQKTHKKRSITRVGQSFYDIRQHLFFFIILQWYTVVLFEMIYIAACVLSYHLKWYILLHLFCHIIWNGITCCICFVISFEMIYLATFVLSYHLKWYTCYICFVMSFEMIYLAAFVLS
jgi:membrane protein DedA with SNARE-associated domain